MDFIDSDEENPKTGSWISIKNLKAAADVHSVYRQQSRGSSPSSSPNASQNSSITMEWKPNTYINQSICFSSMHDHYCEEIIDSTQTLLNESDEGLAYKQDIDAMRYYIQSKESKLRKLQRRYQRDIGKLKDELAQSKAETEAAQKEIYFLNQEIDRMQQDFTQQLLNNQARHERKLQRSKQDLDALISENNEKTAIFVAEKLRAIHQAEMDKLRDDYEEQIERLRMEHELEIQEKEEEYESIISKENNFKIDEERLEEMERAHKKNIESLEDKYEEEIERLKKQIQNMKEERPKKNLIMKFEENKINEKEIQELQEKIQIFQEEAQEQRRIIELQKKTIEDLSKELQGTFKKRPAKNLKLEASIEKDLEKDLKGLIGQISNYLDTSDPNTSRDFGDTLRTLQSRIEFLASSEKLNL
ncbi:unnamed protein product [Blepharisma stoltei]|uniref:Uncharacterized protein n=1 Tax=Blepharisma stoltei TaxID=1481888 RepID=A0AAU9JZB9_9CILI|nr:unnamed protein product [Blepharisma stoltei]